MAAALVLLAAAVAFPVPRPALGVFCVIFALGALMGFRNQFVVEPGRLVARGIVFSKEILLDQLDSAEARFVRSRHYSFWKLCLRDRQGGRVGLSFTATPPAERQRFLRALAPYILAPGVFLAGPIDLAIAGNLWWPSVNHAAEQARQRPPGMPGEHERR
jgi:hypothetical protein